MRVAVVALALQFLTMETRPVTVKVSGGGVEPVTVVMTVSVVPHPDNRAVCLAYEGDTEASQAWRGCWELQGDQSPKTTVVTSQPIYGEGTYSVVADVCRGHWDGKEACAQAWIRSVPARFFVIGRGNRSYPKKEKPHA